MITDYLVIEMGWVVLNIVSTSSEAAKEYAFRCHAVGLQKTITIVLIFEKEDKNSSMDMQSMALSPQENKNADLLQD